MNVALAIEKLVPAAQYNDSSTYDRLVDTWYDSRPVPTEQDILGAWDALVIEKQAENQLQQSLETKKQSAKTEARNVPEWATATAQETSDWIDNNVTDLASASIALKRLAQLVVHLRDAQWPDL